MGDGRELVEETTPLYAKHGRTPSVRNEATSGWAINRESHTMS